MRVTELNRDQLTELKQSYYTQLLDERGESPSYGELADIDDYVSDEEIFDEYAGTDFVPEDFSSSAGDDEDTTLEDKLLALEAKVRFIEQQGYIPFVSPYPSSTEKQLADAVRKAAAYLNQAAHCAHLLRY